MGRDRMLMTVTVSECGVSNGRTVFICRITDPDHLRKVVAALSDLARPIIDGMTGVERRDVKAIARQLRNPASEIVAHGALAKIGGDEAD